LLTCNALCLCRCLRFCLADFTVYTYSILGFLLSSNNYVKFAFADRSMLTLSRKALLTLTYSALCTFPIDGLALGQQRSALNLTAFLHLTSV